MKTQHEGCEREQQQAKQIAFESVGWLCILMSPILMICGIIIGIPLVLFAFIHDLIDKVTNPKK